MNYIERSPLGIKNSVLATGSINFSHTSPQRILNHQRVLQKAFHSASVVNANILSTYIKQVMQKQQEESRNFYKVKVKILSNYGSPDYVRFSKLDLFDIAMNKVIVYKTEVLIPHDKSFYLQREDFLRSDRSGWYCPWNGTPLIISMTVNSKLPVGLLRVICDTENVEQNIKDIEVYIGNKLSKAAEVPRDIGTNISFNQQCFTPKVVQPLVRKKGYFSEDKYGEIPAVCAKILEIDLYGNRNGDVGLNQIEIYNNKGHKIIPDGHYVKISVEGAVGTYPIMNLFKKDKNVTDHNKMWEAGLVADYATIKIKFRTPTPLSLIRIYNHNSCFDQTMFQTSKGRVRINGGTIWIGRIKESHGTTKSVSKYATKIFLSESPATANITKYLDKATK